MIAAPERVIRIASEGMQAIPGLACPACRGDLTADGEAKLFCAACHCAYPVMEGIPSFIAPSAADRMSQYQLTVVIPALNEAANLDDILPALRRELQSLEVTYELLRSEEHTSELQSRG